MTFKMGLFLTPKASFGMRFLALLGVALCGGTASGQDTAGDVFASYALDFCAAVVDGAPWTAAAQTVDLPSPPSRLPLRAHEVPSFIAKSLKADRDTVIYAFSTTDDESVFALVRADSAACLVQAFDRQSPVVGLQRRLDEEAGPWQEQVSREDGGVYERHATDSASGILLHLQFVEGEYAGVLVERTDHRMLKLAKEQRATWATTVVVQCAAGVHDGTPLSPASFAPFFEVYDERAGALNLEGALGHPSGTLALNSRRNRRACDLAIATGGVADLERAIGEALVATGATEQPDGTYLMPKPPDAAGHDAVFFIDRSDGPLEITVERP